MRPSLIVKLKIPKSTATNLASLTMAAEPFPDAAETIQKLIDGTSFESECLKLVKTGIIVVQDRNKEVLEEKEKKILGLGYQLSLLEAETVKLQADNLVAQQTIQETSTELNNVQEANEKLRKEFTQKAGELHKLECARAEQQKVIEGLTKTVGDKKRKYRDFAERMVTNFLELDGDVSVPGWKKVPPAQFHFEEDPIDDTENSDAPTTIEVQPGEVGGPTTQGK